MSTSLPLEAADALSSKEKKELEITIRDLYLQKDLQKLAKNWEPKRKLAKPDEDLKDALRLDLIDLLNGRRSLYAEPDIVPLEDAQKKRAYYQELITRLMPTADAKKLLKSWDKNIKPIPKDREQIVGHLVRLLNGRQSNVRQVA